MDEKAKKSFREIIGLDTASKPVQTVSTVIGGLLGLGGFIGALNEKNQEKTFLQATKDTQLRLGQVGADFGVRAEETKAALGADLSAHQAKMEAQAAQGLESRGLGAFAPASAKQLKAGSSGAYAMARSALEAAKLNAGRAISGSLSAYKQGIAQKQYESMLSQYYGRLGLWGALGGAGASLLEAQDKE